MSGPVMLCIVLVLVFVLGFMIGEDRGERPLRKLRPRSYRIDAVIYTTREHMFVALSWHVDWGHYEHRFAMLPLHFLTATPNPGDWLEVVRDAARPYQVRRAA